MIFTSTYPRRFVFKFHVLSATTAASSVWVRTVTLISFRMCNDDCSTEQNNENNCVDWAIEKGQLSVNGENVRKWKEKIDAERRTKMKIC